MREDLDRRGWEIHEVRVDGCPVDDLEQCDVDLADGARHRVEVNAMPSSSVLDAISRDLSAAIPRFRDECTRLGRAFARGEWRGSLGDLGTFLDELRFVLTGLGLLRDKAGTQGHSLAESLPPVLSELSSQLERRSWVEVSDLLNYELVPLLEDWQEEA